MKISLAQYDVKRGDLFANLKKIEAYARQAADDGSELLCLPEMATTGFDWDANRELLDSANENLRAIAQVAAKCKIQLFGSFLERTEEGNAANTSFFWNAKGEVVGKYRKIHLFTLFHEDQHVEAGKELSVFETSLGRVGLGICYDLRFPELFRRNVELGATVQILPAAFPHPRLEHWRTLVRARAIENQCYFIAINQTGLETHSEAVGTTQYFGHSLVVDPWGEIVAEGGEGESLIHAEIDPSLPSVVRLKFPALRDRRRDLFSK